MIQENNGPPHMATKRLRMLTPATLSHSSPRSSSSAKTKGAETARPTPPTAITLVRPARENEGGVEAQPRVEQRRAQSSRNESVWVHGLTDDVGDGAEDGQEDDVHAQAPGGDPERQVALDRVRGQLGDVRAHPHTAPAPPTDTNTPRASRASTTILISPS